MSEAASLRRPYDGVVVAAPVTIPYERYSIESAQWWIGRALKALVESSGLDKRAIDGLVISSFTLQPDRKIPASGRMKIPLEAFKKPVGAPDDPEVFNAERDCVRP